jgi:hypothetical protein
VKTGNNSKNMDSFEAMKLVAIQRLKHKVAIKEIEKAKENGNRYGELID